MMSRNRNLKIVCTVGPASCDESVLRSLLDAGMDVARLNFSHGAAETHLEVIARLRRLEPRLPILQDLAGPKIRIGEIPGGPVKLVDGETFVLTARMIEGDAQGASVSLSSLSRDVRPGDSIFLADGLIRLQVERIDGADVVCRVLHGGMLSSRKGVNLPGVALSAPTLTEKDRSDLALGIAAGVDYVALSFVRRAEDLHELRRVLAAAGSEAGVVAKIEKHEALGDLDRIVVAADAVMVARGDLGVEIPPESVPVVQKRIVGSCRARSKPVIIATQMLESMVWSERPTRAEASDVANAVLDGADAVMLSAETATGSFPVETVAMMDRIARAAEAYGRDSDAFARPPSHAAVDLVHAVCAGAVEIAERVGASVLACLTHSGATARILASHRPRVPLLALTDHAPVVRQLGLVWGTRAVPVPRIDDTERVLAAAREWVAREGFSGTLALTAGIPTKEKTPTNAVYVVRI